MRPRCLCLPRSGFLAVLLIGLLGGCANDVTDQLIERPLGSLAELGINLQFRMDNDPLLCGYVNQLGAQQRALVRRRNVPYRFKVVDLEEPNAFAIPWGGIYVTRGLLRFAESEEEIAFVMGHEIGHVERRHSSLAFQRNLLINIGLALLTNDKNKDWMQFAYIGNYFLDLHFSRENELSADREGGEYAIRSGYDPEGGIVFFHKLDDRYGAMPRFWSYFQTHPINRDRISELRRQRPFDPNDAAVQLQIAEGYRARHLYASAEDHYRRAASADPENGQAYLGLARIAAWRGDVAAAKQQYLQALRYGADSETVNAELSALPERQPASEGEVILASARELDEVKSALGGLETRIAAVAEVAKPGYERPLGAMTALVNSHNTAGSQLDLLYRIRNQMTRSVQDMVVDGQRVRAMALRAASEVSGAQEEAHRTTELLESNRRRILAILADRPTPAAVRVARAVLTDSERAGREVRDGVQRVTELLPHIESAVKESHAAIAALAEAVQASRTISRQLGERLTEAETATSEALDEVRKSESGIYSARARALESSIDITLLDRTANERLAAQKIIERLMLADSEALARALEAGLSYGEATYALGMAKSTETEPETVITALAASLGERQTVDRLERRSIGRSGKVAIMMRLVDETLKREFEVR